MALMRIRLSNILSVSLVFACTWVSGTGASALKIWKQKSSTAAAEQSGSANDPVPSATPIGTGTTSLASDSAQASNQSDAGGRQIGMRVPQAPENARVLTRHSKLGDAYFERKDYTNALIECQAVLKEDPDNYK